MAQDKTYRCEDCKMDFREEQQYDQHNQQEHSEQYRPQQANARLQQEQ